MRYLADPEIARRLGVLLVNRFREIIVDEAQDCGPEELAILRDRVIEKLAEKVALVTGGDSGIGRLSRSGGSEFRAGGGESKLWR